MNNKTVQILEKNVEWIAMGVGALWVLWVVWAHILTPPTIMVAGQSLTPATIDEYIQDNTRKSLQTLIDSPTVPPGITAGDYKPNWAMVDPGPIAGVPVGSDPPLKPLLNAKDINPGEQILVQKLPVIPPPTDLGLAMGRCQVTLPPPAIPPVAGAADGAAPVVPAIAPRIPGGVAGVPGAPQTADKNWVCVSALLDPAAITKALTDAKIAQFLQKQQFVYVQIERVEVGANGALGKSVIVKELPINVLPDDPTDEKQRDNVMKYLEQPQNQTRVLNPGFYPVASGDIPVPPLPGAMPDAIAAAAANNLPLPGAPQNFVIDGKFDVAAALAYYKTLAPKDQDAFIKSLLADQRAQLYNARIEDEKKNTTPRPGPGPRPVPTPGPQPTPRPTPPPRGRDAVDPDVLREMFAQARPNAPVRRPGPVNPADYFPTIGGRPNAPVMAPNGPVAPMMPAGVNANGQLTIWQYDESAEPGKNYKYRIRVVMINPLYRSNVAVANIKDIFLLEGQWSEWSKPICLPASLKWFLVGASPQAEKATFRIIKWEKGKANPSAPIIVGPGEAVGSNDKANGVDFSTGWTVVDVRQVGGQAERGDTRVTLINEQGEVLIKRVRQDQAEYNKESAAVSPKPSAMAN